MSDNVCDYYRFKNVTRSVQNALEDAFIESSADLKNSNHISIFCDNSDEEVVKVDDSERSNEKENKFDKSLLIHHGQDLVDSLLYSIFFAVPFWKSKNLCSDNEIVEVLSSDLYNQLCNEEDFFQLVLAYHKFERQCFRINKILSKQSHFLRVFEQKKKFYNLLTKNSKK